MEATSAVRRAREALSATGWLDFGAPKRARALRPLAQRVLSRADEFVRERLAQGASRADVELHDVLPVADLMDFWLRSAEELFAPAPLEHRDDFDPIFQPKQRARVLRAPHGVVGIATGEVRPIALPMRAIVPALLAGNAVVVLPSEHTKGTNLLLQSLFAGLLPDPDLLVFVTGAVEDLARSGLDAIAFSGEAERARALVIACAERLVPCSVALTGTSADAAALILSDAALKRAVQGVADQAISGAAPWMARLRRVYVERSVSTRFIEQLRPALAAGELELRVSSNVLELEQSEAASEVVRVFVVADAGKAVDAINERALAMPLASVSVWSRRNGKALMPSIRADVVTLQTHGTPAPIDAVATSLDAALVPFVRTCVMVESRSGRDAELGWTPRSTRSEELVRAAIVARGGGASLLARVRAFLHLIAGYLRRRLASD